MSAYPQAEIIELIQRERLPAGFEATVQKYYAPLAAAFAKRQTALARTMIIGVNGPQGSGKSTLGRFLVLLLKAQHDKRVAVLSLDDIYLAKAERQTLARDVHPLLAVRGVPGTHDVKLGCSVLGRMNKAKPDDVTMIPRFDKSKDDRYSKDKWDSYKGSPDIIIFEGWCVGVQPQSESELAEPANDLERLEDANGEWRRYVNNAIARDYPALFDPIDILVYLKPPGFECVFKWRRLQESKLAAAAKGANSCIMNDSELTRFIMHYERLTRHMMDTMPAAAEVIIEINEKQQAVNMIARLNHQNTSNIN